MCIRDRGMVAINCGTLFMPDGTLGNLFLDPMLSDTDDLMKMCIRDSLNAVQHTDTLEGAKQKLHMFHVD